MRVLFFGQSGPFAAAALEQLQKSLCGAQVVGVVEGPGSKLSAHRRRWFGFGQVGGRLPPLKGSLDLEVHAHAYQVAHHWWGQRADVGQVCAFARRQRAEVAVCVGFPFVWPGRLLQQFGAALNVHPSLLPRWRGPAPLFWWLRSGEPSTGVSVHTMLPQADAGPVWARASLAPPWRTDGKALLQLCGSLGGRLLAGLLNRGLGQAVAATVATAGSRQAATSWAARPRPEDAFVVPHRWPAQALLRFCQGAPYFRTPSLVAAEQRYFVLGGTGLLPAAQVPGDFVRCGNVLWVQAQGGAVGLQLQV